MSRAMVAPALALLTLAACRRAPPVSRIAEDSPPACFACMRLYPGKCLPVAHCQVEIRLFAPAVGGEDAVIEVRGAEDEAL